MKNVRTASLLCFLLCGLPLCAQTVKVNWQTGAPFSTYKTFAWQGPKSQTIPFYGPWVKADVIAELQTKGLTPVAAGQKPDLLVTYHIQGQELVDATSTTDGLGLVRWLGRLGTMVRRFNDLYFGASQNDSHSHDRHGRRSTEQDARFSRSSDGRKRLQIRIGR
jgi:hypothetical protein